MINCTHSQKHLREPRKNSLKLSGISYPDPDNKNTALVPSERNSLRTYSTNLDLRICECGITKVTTHKHKHTHTYTHTQERDCMCPRAHTSAHTQMTARARARIHTHTHTHTSYLLFLSFISLFCILCFTAKEAAVQTSYLPCT